MSTYILKFLVLLFLKTMLFYIRGDFMLRDYNAIEIDDFDEHGKVELLKSLVKTANKRLRNFKAQDLSALSVKKANKYLKDENRKFFSSSKRTAEKNLEKELSQVLEFLQSETSTLRGYKEKAIEYGKRIAEINRVNLQTDEDYRDFYEFVQTGMYDKMKAAVGSPVAIDDYIAKLGKGFTEKDIQAAFEQYRKGKISKFEYLKLEKDALPFED